MLLCRTDQHLQESLPSVTAARGGHTRYWKQRFTYFCNAQICNTGSFFSINKWQRKYFSLTCLIGFSLSTFRTYMKIWWCFGSYLCRDIENSKGFTNFQAALYIYICVCVCVVLTNKKVASCTLSPIQIGFDFLHNAIYKIIKCFARLFQSVLDSVRGLLHSCLFSSIPLALCTCSKRIYFSYLERYNFFFSVCVCVC